MPPQLSKKVYFYCWGHSWRGHSPSQNWTLHFINLFVPCECILSGNIVYILELWKLTGLYIPNFTQKLPRYHGNGLMTKKL